MTLNTGMRLSWHIIPIEGGYQEGVHIPPFPSLIPCRALVMGALRRWRRMDATSRRIFSLSSALTSSRLMLIAKSYL